MDGEMNEVFVKDIFLNIEVEDDYELKGEDEREDKGLMKLG